MPCVVRHDNATKENCQNPTKIEQLQDETNMLFFKTFDIRGMFQLYKFPNHVWSYQRRSHNHQNRHVSSRARTVCIFPDEVNFFNNVQLTYVIASETRYFFYTIKGHLPSLKEVYRLYLIGHTFRTFKLYLVSGFIQIKRNRTLV